MPDPTELAGCVLRDDEGRILLLHRNMPHCAQWELPGGKVEDGESAEEAARREVREELGLEVHILKELGGHSFEEQGRCFRYTWFLAVITAGAPHIRESDKFDAWRLWGWDELTEIEAQLSPNMRNLLEDGGARTGLFSEP